ncbi:PDZ domain-containing protein [Leptolyngbya cf. ectocarpi LEGE 11479]|uniref:Carboxyl-terminal-processing protease n=1 Tax=Leptolyngbya cf. ectocarpi LEGE 11479 TaxID=1828722 RepID=A0A928WYR8_LEPEC|nr:PDZ domain-containing protein [Leptolyngbya cf. ectocarpi LEGE 11479]
MRKTGLLPIVLLKGICAICIATVLGLGMVPSPAFAFTEQQKLVMEVWRIVNRAYLDETFNHQNWWFTREKALKRSLNTWEDAYKEAQSMLQKLDDPYTRFLPPEQYQSLQTNTSGELLGVGLQIAKDDDNQHLRVIAPIVGSPAERAGLSPRDEIVAINGVPTQSFSLDEAAARMRGPAGTIVTLKIERLAVDAFEVNLTRERINLNPVFSELRSEGTSQIGYLRLGQFNGNAVEDIRSALMDLERQEAAGYVLDLRNNPGGLLQAGIEIARLWLEQSTIVYTVNRQGILESFEAGDRALTQKPLVLLVNGGTASASEILAGALQDNQRAQLVGETTFGKGLIQSLFDLTHGSGLAVTVAKYETPNHHDINKLGITPDRVVPTEPLTRDQLATSEDPQYQAAVELLQQSLMPAMT